MRQAAPLDHARPGGPQPGARAALSSRLRRAGAWAAVTLVLLAVFTAYLDPSMAMQLAQQLWSCF